MSGHNPSRTKPLPLVDCAKFVHVKLFDAAEEKIFVILFLRIELVSPKKAAIAKCCRSVTGGFYLKGGFVLVYLGGSFVLPQRERGVPAPGRLCPGEGPSAYGRDISRSICDCGVTRELLIISACGSLHVVGLSPINRVSAICFSAVILSNL